MPLPDTAVIDQEQIWCQTFDSARRFSTARPALFLDRDGVIVEEVHYLHKAEDVALIKGAGKVIASANQQDIPVIIVTNQSGLARGMFGWTDFAEVQARMLALLAAESGAFVDAVYACPHHKSGAAPFNVDNHPARKPNPGMLTRAAQALPLDMTGSWIIGDKASDLGAGKASGLAGGVHVLTGHGQDDGERQKALALEAPDFQVKRVDSIAWATGLFSP